MCSQRLSQILATSATIAILLASSLSADDEFKSELRTWTDSSGQFTVEAQLVKVSANDCTLQRSDGSTVTVSIKKLSVKDQEFIARFKKNRAAKNSQSESQNHADDHAMIDGSATVKCQTCRGSRIVPLKPLKLYVWIEGKNPTQKSETIGYCPCPECQKDASLDKIEQDYSRRHQDKRHEDWEQRLDRDLTKIETHFYTIHSQLTDNVNRQISMSLEKMQRHIQMKTGSMKLIPTRRWNHEIFLLKDREEYLHFLEVVRETTKDEQFHRNFELMKKVHSSRFANTLFTHDRSYPKSIGMPNAIVNTTAFFQMEVATEWKAPPWLATGFGAYNEYHIFKANICFPVEYKFRNQKTKPNWEKILKEYARKGDLESWDSLFHREIRDYKTIDFVQCKSVVTFLISQPDKFMDMVYAIDNGVHPIEAVEQAYELPIGELEKQWLRKIR